MCASAFKQGFSTQGIPFNYLKSYSTSTTRSFPASQIASESSRVSFTTAIIHPIQLTGAEQLLFLVELSV